MKKTLFVRLLVCALLALTLAACASVPAPSDGGGDAFHTEDQPPEAADGVSPDSETPEVTGGESGPADGVSPVAAEPPEVTGGESGLTDGASPDSETPEVTGGESGPVDGVSPVAADREAPKYDIVGRWIMNDSIGGHSLEYVFFEDGDFCAGEGDNFTLAGTYSAADQKITWNIRPLDNADTIGYYSISGDTLTITHFDIVVMEFTRSPNQRMDKSMITRDIQDVALKTRAEANARLLAGALNTYNVLYADNGRAQDFRSNPDAVALMAYLLDNAGNDELTCGISLPRFNDPDDGNRAIDNLVFDSEQNMWNIADDDSLNFKDPPRADFYPVG